MRFNRFYLCDTNINHSVGRTYSLIIPSLITTLDTMLIIIIELVIIHMQCMIITIITMGLISSPLVTTPRVVHS